MKLRLNPCSTGFLILIFFSAASCCPDTVPQRLPISIESFELENWNKNEINSFPSISIQDYALIIFNKISGLENFQSSENRGFLRSPDCDPPDPEVFLDSPIRTIQVFTETDFTNSYPTGSEITELFSTRIINLNPQMTSPEIIETEGINVELLNSQIRQESSVALRDQEIFKFYGVFFKNLELGMISGKVQFRLVFILENKKVIEVIGEEFIIHR